MVGQGPSLIFTLKSQVSDFWHFFADFGLDNSETSQYEYLYLKKEVMDKNKLRSLLQIRE
jgi:hypothetical protein